MQLGTPVILEPRLVGELEGTFFVPDYQRGYRWGVEEVRQLLQDITDARGEKYYLQPVVVKRMLDGRWEVVDGQQRLTTIYLILRSMHDYLPKSQSRYSLEYETRPGSAAYLDKPDESLSNKNIDYFHMHQAFRTIAGWLQEQNDASSAAIELYRALKSSVYVIWYEAPQEPEFDSRALFTRLNVGRIPLTDAELVKASLLSRIRRRHETAAQWDAIERDLWNPEVWAFITGPAAPPAATRIELLLDTVADLEVGSRPEHRPRFHTFETLRPLIQADARRVWDRVVDLHSEVLGWYDDRSLFHKIGYLVAAGAARFFDLVKLADGSTKSAFSNQLDAAIARTIDLPWRAVTALNYGSPKSARVLLLMNVETVRTSEHSFERYSFSQQARRMWSLEHIHAQRSEGLSTVDQWKTWLSHHARALDSLGLTEDKRAEVRARVAQALPSISSQSFELLHQELVGLFCTADESPETGQPSVADREDVDSIANLALLARDDNAVLNNSVFEVKRQHVIDMDQKGVYIPVCTRNVFLKYYSTATAQQIHFWGPLDREAYLGAMQAKLQPYLLEDTPENDARVKDDEEQEAA